MTRYAWACPKCANKRNRFSSQSVRMSVKQSISQLRLVSQSVKSYIIWGYIHVLLVTLACMDNIHFCFWKIWKLSFMWSSLVSIWSVKSVYFGLMSPPESKNHFDSFYWLVKLLENHYENFSPKRWHFPWFIPVLIN